MQNSSMNLAEFINHVASIYIPIYHRCYYGNIQACNIFFEQATASVEKTLQSKNLGIITLQKCDNNGNYILVDGYQRIISLYLFLLALNNTEQTGFIPNIELKINNNDKIDIQNIIDRNLLENDNWNPKIIEAYNFFQSKMQEKNYNFNDILNNLQKISIINVTLEDNISDIENIYCNLNQTFSQSDLIRNFIYKQLKDNKLIHIFNTHWLVAEKILGINISKFITDYLTIQNNGLIPKQNGLYKEFIEFFTKFTKFKAKEDAIKHIYRYANYYTRIINSNIKDTELKDKLKEINSYKACDTYPYLMEVFEDYEYAHINKHILLEILDTVILFVQNRTKSLDNQDPINFASLSKDLNKMLVLKDYTPRIITQDLDDSPDSLKITINKLTQSR